MGPPVEPFADFAPSLFGVVLRSPELLPALSLSLESAPVGLLRTCNSHALFSLLFSYPRQAASQLSPFGTAVCYRLDESQNRGPPFGAWKLTRVSRGLLPVDKRDRSQMPVAKPRCGLPHRGEGATGEMKDRPG